MRFSSAITLSLLSLACLDSKAAACRWDTESSKSLTARPGLCCCLRAANSWPRRRVFGGLGRRRQDMEEDCAEDSTLRDGLFLASVRVKAAGDSDMVCQECF